MEWYSLLGLGFATGIYLTSAKVRHVINTLIAQALLGIVWFLHFTDKYYKEPRKVIYKVTRPAVKDYSHKPSVQISDDALEEILAGNPEIKVTER